MRNPRAVMPCDVAPKSEMKPRCYDTPKDKAARVKVHGHLVDFCRSNPPSIIQGTGRRPRSAPFRLPPATGVNRYLAKIQAVKRNMFVLNRQERLNYTIHRLLRYLGWLVVLSYGDKPQYSEMAKKLLSFLEVRLAPRQVAECAFCGKKLQKRFFSIHLKVHEKDETPRKIEDQAPTDTKLDKAVEDDDQLFLDPTGADLLLEADKVVDKSFEEVSNAMGYDSVETHTEPFLSATDSLGKNSEPADITKEYKQKTLFKPICPITGCPAPFTVEHPNLIHCHRQTRAFGQRIRNDLLFSAVFVTSKTRGTRQMVKVRTGTDPIPLWVVFEVKHGFEVRAAAAFYDDGSDAKSGMAIKFRLVSPDGLRSPEENWGRIAPMTEKNLCEKMELGVRWEVCSGNAVYLLDGLVPSFFG